MYLVSQNICEMLQEPKNYEMGAQRRNEKNDRDCSLFRRWREPSCADIPMEPIPTDLEQTDGDGRRYEDDS